MGRCSGSVSFAWKLRKGSKLQRNCFVAVVLFFATSCFAGDMVVIGEFGPVRSTNEYYKLVDFNKVTVSPEALSNTLEFARKTLTKDVYFPLRSSKLSPGIMKSYRFNNRKKLSPFAVVGSDALSLKWLGFRYSTLVDINAVIYVVEASSFGDIRRMKEKFPELTIAPASEGDIPDMLKVRSYPFLVNASGVFQ